MLKKMRNVNHKHLKSQNKREGKETCRTRNCKKKRECSSEIRRNTEKR